MTRPIWPEAEIIADPLRNASEPRILVRRRKSPLVDSAGDPVCSHVENPVISLFTGAGGMDIGLERAGWTTIVQHEWTECACQTLIANRPGFFRHAALIQGDIRKTPTALLLEQAGLLVGQVAGVVGGPPCQGFSTANTSAVKNKADTRNDLVFEYLRVVADAKPVFFVFENVPGFQRFNQGEYMRRFLRTAYGCYYELVYGLIDCCDYGVPQRRCRFICVGTRRDVVAIKGKLAGLPAPEHFGPGDISRMAVMPQHMRRDLTVTPGVRYFPDRPILTVPEPNHGQERSKAFVEFYARLRRDEPDRLVEPQYAREADPEVLHQVKREWVPVNA